MTPAEKLDYEKRIRELAQEVFNLGGCTCTATRGEWKYIDQEFEELLASIMELFTEVQDA